MSSITFIIGGARSGKSKLAIKLAREAKNRVCFIATCRPEDYEMRIRVRRHKSSRPNSWRTIEEPRNLTRAIRKAANSKCVIIDCITLWISNLIISGMNKKEILKMTSEVISAIKKFKLNALIVSNEVGLGIVPDNRVARDFRDIAGEVNQLFAQKADKVYFVVSGIPMTIKPLTNCYPGGSSW